MGFFKRTADLIYTFRFIKLLTTKFENTEAYKRGLIDERGNRTSKRIDSRDRDHYSKFHRLVFNIKKLTEKVPGGKSFSSYAAALYLLKEEFNINPEKVTDELNISPSLFSEEYTSWFVNDEDMLSPGIYKAQHEMMVSSTAESIIKKKDKIKVFEGTYPVDEIFGLKIYKAQHILSGEDVYVTPGDLIK